MHNSSPEGSKVGHNVLSIADKKKMDGIVIRTGREDSGKGRDYPMPLMSKLELLLVRQQVFPGGTEWFRARSVIYS